MDESHGPRRRRWSHAARAARERMVQEATDYRPVLATAIEQADTIEREAHDNPQLVIKLVDLLNRDLALVQLALADIRTLAIEPRPDPLHGDPRRVGWPPDLVPLMNSVASTAQEQQELLFRVLEVLRTIREEAHDNPRLIRELTLLLQRDLALIAAALANIRSSMLQIE